MATWAYPPLPPARLEQEVESTLAKELEWLLRSLQDSLVSLREGLHDCAALLAPKEPGSTLVLSSLRSENVKGYVTRVGTQIVKGDIQLRLSSLASVRGSANTRLCLSNASEAPELVLDQLVSVKNLVNQSLDIVDVSTWTGDPLNAGFIFSQLHLLRETITEARQMLKGESDKVKQKWWEASAAENMFDPPLPPCLSFHLTIADSALVLHLRTLESSTPTHTPTAFASDISLTGFNIRDRLFGTRHRPHDEAGDVFTWKGDEVKVKEKVRVESQDPSLMAVMAKLTALEHEVQKWISALKVLMGLQVVTGAPVYMAYVRKIPLPFANQRYILLYFTFQRCGQSRGPVRMLSRSPATRATPQGLLRAAVNRTSQFSTQQLRRGAASFVNGRSRTTTTRRCLSSTSSTNKLPRAPTEVRPGQWTIGSRYSSSATPAVPDATHAERKDAVYALIDEINQNEAAMADIMEELDLLDDFDQALNLDGLEYEHAFSQTIGHRDQETLEGRVRMARQEFREYLPPDYLNARETELYTRLYGEPIYRDLDSIQPDLELAEELEEAQDPAADQLYREDGQGGWEEVEMVEEELELELEPEEDDVPVVYDMEAGPEVPETDAMRRTREIAEQLGGEVMLEQFQDEAVPDGNDNPRFHPTTELGRSGTNPSTVFLPNDTLVKPISMILSDFSNKHLQETARRVFKGQYLPLSVTTPPRSVQAPQLPSPLEASQRHMSEMESNAYLAAMYPGFYASVLSVLVEVRKRLGTDWLRGLMTKEEGPSVLDASAGGAGIIAWREIMRAEWEVMDPERPFSEIPIGKSTVVVGSNSLRARASALLHNTTFLPRLPDYVHLRENATLDDDRAPKRKQFDIVIAPHSIHPIDEEYLRKEHVKNLWQLVNPNGGILILLEKGHQRGFEAIAGARDMLLKRVIRNTDLKTSDEDIASEEDAEEELDLDKEPGMIIAPCTNHAQCPMYRVPGHTVGRGDWCHFKQRYIRPPFLQRIIDAKTHNHEDLRFSYLAVQRGVDLREEKGFKQDRVAKFHAAKGYEHLFPDPQTRAAMTEEEQQRLAEQEAQFEPLTLPRIVYPPLKRRGHVTFDICTPDAQIERWTVPRSFSRQAYRDVRKSQWGDLWALGSKTQIERKVKLGTKHGLSKKDRLEARAAAREAAKDAQEEEEADAAAQDRKPELLIPKRKKGEKIPSWKKHQDKKKVRQHYSQLKPTDS